MAKRRTPVCPLCGNKANKIVDDWGTGHKCCGLRSRDYKPLVDEQTLRARRVAHNVFDTLWKEAHMTRKQAYTFLAERMGLSKGECHIGLLTYSQLTKVIDISKEMRTKWIK